DTFELVISLKVPCFPPSRNMVIVLAAGSIEFTVPVSAWTTACAEAPPHHPPRQRRQTKDTTRPNIESPLSRQLFLIELPPVYSGPSRTSRRQRTLEIDQSRH